MDQSRKKLSTHSDYPEPSISLDHLRQWTSNAALKTEAVHNRKYSSAQIQQTFSRKYSSIQQTFSGEKDIFKGITVDSAKENCTPQKFVAKLEESLNKWKNERQRCIWFKVNIKHAFYVPILAEKGFNFHHARDESVMMYKWLPEDSEANLPPAPHTNLGVGAMVFNSREQMLAISEKHYDYPHWKLPGGYVERGEDIVDAAIREVKEETGVNAAFLSLVTFRHTHKMMFGNSDIYILLMLQALSDEITPSHREVKECKWMDVKEYTNHPHVHEFNRLVVNKAIEYRNRQIKLDIKKKTVQWSKFVREMNFLFIEHGKY